MLYSIRTTSRVNPPPFLLLHRVPKSGSVQLSHPRIVTAEALHATVWRSPDLFNASFKRQDQHDESEGRDKEVGPLLEQFKREGSALQQGTPRGRTQQQHSHHHLSRTDSKHDFQRHLESGPQRQLWQIHGKDGYGLVFGFFGKFLCLESGIWGSQRANTEKKTPFIFIGWKRTINECECRALCRKFRVQAEIS